MIGHKTALLAALFGSALAAAPAGAAPRNESISLVEARLSKVDDIWDEPNAPRICTEDGQVCFDGSWRLWFTVTRTIVGAKVRAPLSVERASAQPRLNHEYLLVVSADNQILFYTDREGGLCADPADIAQWGLMNAAKKWPCRM